MILDDHDFVTRVVDRGLRGAGNRQWTIVARPFLALPVKDACYLVNCLIVKFQLIFKFFHLRFRLLLATQGSKPV